MLGAMTKQQLIEQVAGTTGHTRSEVERLYEALVEKVAAALEAGEKVDMRGLGIFDVKDTKARSGRNPGTGAVIEIPASRKAGFRPSKELKDRLSTSHKAMSAGGSEQNSA